MPLQRGEQLKLWWLTPGFVRTSKRRERCAPYFGAYPAHTHSNASGNVCCFVERSV